MEIRTLTPEDRPRQGYLMSQAFGYGEIYTEGDEWEESKDGRATTYGIWDEAGLQCSVTILHYQIYLGERSIVSMGGVGGVTSLPASRGKGYAGQCLRHALGQMHEKGHVVSVLYPFSWDFYRKLGYEWVGQKRTYSVPSSILRADATTENVRLATEEDRSALTTIYTEYARRYRGSMVRQEWQYDQVFRDENKKYAFTYLYEANGQPQGYFTYRGGSKENTRLREFIALTPEAQRGLLGLLHRHEMQIDKFSWAAPADDSLWSLQYHWDIDTRLEPFAQARIVDAPAALQGWRPEPGQEGVVILKLHDPVCDWNEGVWRIEFGGGEVSVARTEAEPQVSMDIQALTQLYFGWPTPEMLRHSGRLKVQEEMGLIALTSLLHGPTFWLNNHF